MSDPRPYSFWRASLKVASALAITASAAYGQDLDRVILTSGNPVVGEIEELRRGRLDVDTEEMDVVRIDWDDIALVTSGRIWEVTDVEGFQYFGRLGQTDQEGTLVVVLGTAADTLVFSEVVEMTYIGGGFLAKTNGFLDLGSNLTRANNLASILLKGRFAYRGLLWDFDLEGETYFQRQETITDVGDVLEERTSRNSSSFSASRFFGGSWAATSSAEVEQNEELNLDARILLILMGEYHFIRNQRMELYTGSGGAMNRETFTGEETNSSAEITFEAGFDAFDVGDLDVFTSVTTFVAPSDGGRFRVNLDARISYEIFNDFVVGVSVTEAYDSEPPTVDAGRDFQYGLTLGWGWGS